MEDAPNNPDMEEAEENVIEDLSAMAEDVDSDMVVGEDDIDEFSSRFFEEFEDDNPGKWDELKAEYGDSIAFIFCEDPIDDSRVDKFVVRDMSRYEWYKSKFGIEQDGLEELKQQGNQEAYQEKVFENTIESQDFILKRCVIFDDQLGRPLEEGDDLEDLYPIGTLVTLHNYVLSISGYQVFTGLKKG